VNIESWKFLCFCSIRFSKICFCIPCAVLHNPYFRLVRSKTAVSHFLSHIWRYNNLIFEIHKSITILLDLPFHHFICSRWFYSATFLRLLVCNTTFWKLLVCNATLLKLMVHNKTFLRLLTLWQYFLLLGFIIWFI